MELILVCPTLYPNSLRKFALTCGKKCRDALGHFRRGLEGGEKPVGKPERDEQFGEGIESYFTGAFETTQSRNCHSAFLGEVDLAPAQG
jgi:hypothetical protein